MTDLIHIDGKPYVLVPMHEYRRLIQAANNGGAVAQADLPDAVMDELVAQAAHPVKILRKHRGLTQMDLASRACLSRPYLTEIESGKKTGTLTTLRAIAQALGVDVSLLLES